MKEKENLARSGTEIHESIQTTRRLSPIECGQDPSGGAYSVIFATDVLAQPFGTDAHVMFRSSQQVPAAIVPGAAGRNQWVGILQISMELGIVSELSLISAPYGGITADLMTLLTKSHWFKSGKGFVPSLSCSQFKNCIMLATLTFQRIYKGRIQFEPCIER